jgi:hypothetical protein
MDRKPVVQKLVRGRDAYFTVSWSRLRKSEKYEIRLRTDAELENDAARRALLEKYDCWYRWSLLSSSDDMSDILFFFAQTHLPGTLSVHHSGRYVRIFVNELDADKIVTI